MSIEGVLGDLPTLEQLCVPLPQRIFLSNVRWFTSGLHGNNGLTGTPDQSDQSEHHCAFERVRMLALDLRHHNLSRTSR